MKPVIVMCFKSILMLIESFTFQQDLVFCQSVELRDRLAISLVDERLVLEAVYHLVMHQEYHFCQGPGNRPKNSFS